MAEAENKVTFGLENVHYAVIENKDNKITYPKILSLPGAVELSMDPAGESETFYADNVAYYISTANQGYTGKITIANMTKEFEELVLGIKYDDNGVQIETTEDKINSVGLSFEMAGDKFKTRFALLNVSFSRPSFSAKTKEDKSEVNTLELEFTAAPDPYNKIFKTRLQENENSEKYNTWFEEFYIPVVSQGSSSQSQSTSTSQSSSNSISQSSSNSISSSNSGSQSISGSNSVSGSQSGSNSISDSNSESKPRRIRK